MRSRNCVRVSSRQSPLRHAYLGFAEPHRAPSQLASAATVVHAKDAPVSHVLPCPDNPAIDSPTTPTEGSAWRLDSQHARARGR